MKNNFIVRYLLCFTILSSFLIHASDDRGWTPWKSPDFYSNIRSGKNSDAYYARFGRTPFSPSYFSERNDIVPEQVDVDQQDENVDKFDDIDQNEQSFVFVTPDERDQEQDDIMLHFEKEKKKQAKKESFARKREEDRKRKEVEEQERAVLGKIERNQAQEQQAKLLLAKKLQKEAERQEQLQEKQRKSDEVKGKQREQALLLVRQKEARLRREQAAREREDKLLDENEKRVNAEKIRLIAQKKADLEITKLRDAAALYQQSLTGLDAHGASQEDKKELIEGYEKLIDLQCEIESRDLDNDGGFFVAEEFWAICLDDLKAILNASLIEIIFNQDSSILQSAFKEMFDGNYFDLNKMFRQGIRNFSQEIIDHARVELRELNAMQKACIKKLGTVNAHNYTIAEYNRQMINSILEFVSRK